MVRAGFVGDEVEAVPYVVDFTGSFALSSDGLSPSCCSLAFSAASFWASFFGQSMLMHVTHGRLPPRTFISGEPQASQVVPKGMISPRCGSG